MDTLFTWEMLATLASASTLCYLIVSQIKPYTTPLKWLRTDLISVLVAFIILACANLFTVGLTPSNAVLALLNAFVVSAVAGKMHDQAK